MSQALNDEKNKQDKVRAVPMEKRASKERVNSFAEVALGYTEDQAIAESERCLSCPNPKCVKGCPQQGRTALFRSFASEHLANTKQ